MEIILWVIGIVVAWLIFDMIPYFVFVRAKNRQNNDTMLHQVSRKIRKYLRMWKLRVEIASHGDVYSSVYEAQKKLYDMYDERYKEE